MGTHFKGKAAESRALDTFIKLSRATRSFHQHLERRLAEQGLTQNQLGVLEMLLHLGPMCQRALGQKLFTSGANVTMLVDQLEERGLVKRERDANDRRFLTVHLTGDGRKFIERIFPSHAAAIAEAMSTLSASEQEELGRMCRKLGLALEGAHQDEED
jgi:MarR family 2-MHQ and catechol resistance regulon transcriptional repressor